MVEIIQMPRTLRITDRTDPELEPFSRSGGVSLSGQEQIITPLSSRWKFSFSVPVIDKTAARSWRALKAKLAGRYNYLEVRICDQYRITRRDVGANYPDADVPHSDGTRFDDSSGYALATPDAHMTVDAAENSTQLHISNAELGGQISAGVFFSINGWLYLVIDWSRSGDDVTLDIDPPLRRAQHAGDTLNFDARFVGRLDSDLAQLDLQVGKYGLVSLTMIEDPGRAI